MKWEPRPKLILIVILWAILCLAFVRCGHSAEYAFAPHSPASFKRAVRGVLAARPERWIEVPHVGPWQAGPLTFQWVNGGNVNDKTPVGTLPAGTEIDRGLFCVAWVYHGAHVSINYNRAAKSTPEVMAQDINALIGVMDGK